MNKIQRIIGPSLPTGDSTHETQGVGGGGGYDVIAGDPVNLK